MSFGCCDPIAPPGEVLLSTSLCVCQGKDGDSWGYVSTPWPIIRSSLVCWCQARLRWGYCTCAPMHRGPSAQLSKHGLIRRWMKPYGWKGILIHLLNLPLPSSDSRKILVAFCVLKGAYVFPQRNDRICRNFLGHLSTEHAFFDHRQRTGVALECLFYLERKGCPIILKYKTLVGKRELKNLRYGNSRSLFRLGISQWQTEQLIYALAKNCLLTVVAEQDVQHLRPLWVRQLRATAFNAMQQCNNISDDVAAGWTGWASTFWWTVTLLCHFRPREIVYGTSSISF